MLWIFFEFLDSTDKLQVVIVHDPRGYSSGFYYSFQDCVGNFFRHTCCVSNIDPMRVVGSRLANVVFCERGLSPDMNVDLTPNQVYDDYKNESWTCVNYNMNYAQ